MTRSSPGRPGGLHGRAGGALLSLRRGAGHEGGDLLLWWLAVGALGLAWPTATVAAYLPTVLRDLTSSDAVIGLVLASEGIFALLIPLIIGPLSDGTTSPLGKRRPYLLLALPPMAVAVALVASMSTLWATTLVLFVFFFGNYVYEPPWRGLYADLVPPESAGRAQAAAHVLRGVAMGGALVGGGLALARSESLPFLIAGIVTAVTCAAVPFLVEEREHGRRAIAGTRSHLRAPWQVVRRDRHVRLFLVANTAWETTFAGMRTFVVLYIVDGLGESLAISSSVLAVVALGYLLAALVLVPFADRLGIGRVILWAAVVYGTGLFCTVFATSWHSWYYLVVLVVGAAGGAVMTLAWGLLYRLMPAHDQGAISALAVMTRGVGLLLGPPLAGVAVDLFEPLLQSTSGYAAVWPTVGIPVLASVPIVLRLWRREQQVRAEATR